MLIGRDRGRGVTSTILLLILISCSEREPEHGIQFDKGGVVSVPANLATRLATAETATLHRVTGEFNSDYEQHKNAPKVAGHPAFAKAQLSASAAKEIATIITTGSNYLHENETWTCLPQPMYLIEYKGRNGDVNVIIHECGDVEINEWMHGLKPSAQEHRLWEILKQALPDLHVHAS